MKLPLIFFYAILFCIFSSFGLTQACEYAGSNISYVQKETEKALEKNDLQVMRFHIYKALDAISKSDKQLADCGCKHAADSLVEVSELLKSATKTTSLASIRILLEKALHHVTEAHEALRDHEQHDSPYGTDDLTVNTTNIRTEDTLPVPPDEKILKQKIDFALKKYKISLQKVINTVNCKEAKAFATGIYENCEQQLLDSNLSEGKKYYNLRTKEITGKALEILDDCKGKQ